MAIGAIGAATTTSAASQASTGLNQNFDTFLTLLTQQLKNQDPLSPLDSSKFVSQLVEFSSVEQQIAQNKHLETLVNQSQVNSATSAVGFIGRQVTLNSSTSQLADGAAKWTYNLPQDAQSAQVVVFDKSGRVVFQQDVDKTAGAHDFTWDGKDNNGETLPDGAYSIQVSAKDASDNAINANVTVQGIVTGVDFSGSDPALLMGDVRAGFADILSVRDLNQTTGA